MAVDSVVATAARLAANAATKKREGAVKAQLRRYTQEKSWGAIDFLSRLVEDETASNADRVKAAINLLDRGMGKPTSGVKIESTSTSHKIEQQLPPPTTQELERLVAQGTVIDMTPVLSPQDLHEECTDDQ